MKKLSFIIAASVLTSSISFAQEISPFDLGPFENLNTIVDKKTNKERPITNEELKARIIADVSKKLTDLDSTRKINIAKVSVYNSNIIVPLVEADGSPFYSVLIDRETGLTNSEIITKELQKSDDKMTSKWEKSFIDQEKRMDDSKKAVLEYRKNMNKPTDTLLTETKRVTDILFTPKKPSSSSVKKYEHTHPDFKK